MIFESIGDETVHLSSTPLPCEKARRLAYRFPLRIRARVCALAASDPRIAQLMRVFPGVLAELARLSSESTRRQAIVGLILTGAPLKDVARSAGLPLWLRRLPPEAFEKPLPGDMAALLPAHEIANHLPRSTSLAAHWLEIVIEAARVCDGPFAAWVARERLHWPRRHQLDRIRLLGLYAWHSRNPGQRPSLVPHASWTASLGFETAARQAKDWLDRLHIRLMLAGREAEPWLKPKACDGYEFVPLLTAAEIDAEAASMKNCLITYGGYVRRRQVQLWSVRLGEERIATMSIASFGGSPLLRIEELRLYNNADAPVGVWTAAHNWLTSHPASDLVRQSAEDRSREPERSAWIATWRPYWLSRRRIPAWLPLSPSVSSLRRLRGYNHQYD